eukprot:TRINITY_DN3831_c0_g1_i4.p2 TRINITY_DN3831_c0_g1~~TRINITY_DN3831_c0_g1_i4.p2  ORF type:complete len:177 (-),score=23.19 TRINITY_DN3831_c0_g1_i4:1574-2104(-)
MAGHENAYRVRWISGASRKPRTGFAHVALSCGRPVKIFPTFMSNNEESRFNPFLYVWNALCLGWLYEVCLVELARQSHTVAAWVLMLAEFVWFFFSAFTIPIPVKVTLHIGDPVVANPDTDTAEEVAERVKLAMRALIREHQPWAPQRNIRHALAQRFPWLPSSWAYQQSERAKSE